MDLANKYRPKCLDDVVGQVPVVQSLKNAVTGSSLHHAYLFTGNMGSGKTSISRILAAMLNCETSPGLHPCNKCYTCQSIFHGTHVDIEEIDAASGAGNVEQIRNLKRDAAYNPVAGAKYKIYIIDECHAMSSSANDALLKVLEEPPQRVIFILATTDPQKIKPTIESRCQRHDFQKLPWSLMPERLSYVCQKENVQCDAVAINLCARLANGSMRTALQNLDKLLVFTGNKIVTADDAQKLFAQANETLYYDLIDKIIGIRSDGTKEEKPDASDGFKILNQIISSGTNFESIYENIAQHLRCIMVGLTSSQAGKFLSLSEEGKRRLRMQLDACKELQAKEIEKHKGQTPSFVVRVINCLNSLCDAYRAYEYNMSLELIFQKWFIESVFAFRK